MKDVNSSSLHKKWSFPLRFSSLNVSSSPQETADLVTFTDETINGKHFFVQYILSAFQQRNYVRTMEHSGSPVLNPLKSLVILFSIDNHSYCVMGWRERPTVSVKKNSLWNFPIQISETRQGSILAGSCRKSNYQDFSLILPSFRDWFMTIIRKYND